MRRHNRNRSVGKGPKEGEFYGFEAISLVTAILFHISDFLGDLSSNCEKTGSLETVQHPFESERFFFSLQKLFGKSLKLKGTIENTSISIEA